MKIRPRFYSAACATVMYFLCCQVYAQQAFPSAMAPYTDQQISIDGVEDEAAWGNITESTGFWQSFPTDSLPAKEQTSFKILVDDANLYLLVKAYSVSEDYIVPSLRRDYDGYVNDNVTFLFDTYNDQTNAFMFGVNPYGVQRESLISNGGNDYRDMDSSWDAKWEVKTRQYLGYYLSEIRIPFHSIRFLEGTTQWRFNMFRYNSHTGEYTVWSRIPQHQKLIGLAFTGSLDFERPLGKSKTPLSLIPYTNTLAVNDYENDTEIRSLSVGGDAKIALTNGLQLDLTFNPDFSQVEVDDQVINLTRFEVTLPEKRQFFIENSDLFSNFGTGYDIRPFFSRRIGVAKDANGETIQNKILAGMRLSGKINERLRVGLLNMQTESDVDKEIAANNNTVFTLQQQLFSRSNVKLLFINRQATGSYDFLAAEDRYNRLLGADYNLASKDNRWTGRFFGYQTFSPQGGRDNAAAGASIRHNTRKHSYHLGSVYIGEDYQADLGYLKRTDLFKLSAGYTYKIWPKKGSINNILLSQRLFSFYKPGMDFLHADHTHMSEVSLQFNNFTNMELKVYKRYTYLLEDFDPTRSDSEHPLPANQGYTYTSAEFSYGTDRSKTFFANIEPSFGQFYNGRKFSLESDLNWRIQPYFQWLFRMRYDQIDLPNPYPNASLWLLDTKFDITFSKKLFLSSTLQYASQSQDLGVNARLQWRFAPLSDLYLVYNDQYLYDHRIRPTMRSINLKLSYWLAL